MVSIVDGKTCRWASISRQGEVALTQVLAFAAFELWSPHHVMVSMPVPAAVHHAGTPKAMVVELGSAL